MPVSRLRPNPHPAPGYARRAALRARPTMLSMGGGYSGKVLGTGPIAYWPLWEESGAVARCLVNPAQNGNAVGVSWNNTLGPDGVNGAPFFDGANDYVNINAAAFSAVFNGETGSLSIWIRVANAGVWTDGARRSALHIERDANNYLFAEKSTVNNTNRYVYTANGVFGPRLGGGKTSVAWNHIAVTWSDLSNSNRMIAYWNGVQEGAIVTPVGDWNVGVLVSAVIGASTAVPGNPYHGWLAHCAIWDRELPQPTIEALATV